MGAVVDAGVEVLGLDVLAFFDFGDFGVDRETTRFDMDTADVVAKSGAVLHGIDPVNGGITFAKARSSPEISFRVQSLDSGLFRRDRSAILGISKPMTRLPLHPTMARLLICTLTFTTRTMSYITLGKRTIPPPDFDFSSNILVCRQSGVSCKNFVNSKVKILYFNFF